MSYFGGKAQDGVFQTIINQIPIHDRYIETFLGGGAIMRKKKPAKINIGLEMNVKSIELFDISKINASISIIQGCGIEYLRARLNGLPLISKTFIYCDPPYLHRNRGKTRYKFEMSDQDHINLLEIIRQLPFYIAISTYPNEIYSEMLNDWRMLEYYSTDRAGNSRLENLYMNYPEPIFLHDDQYLGDNANNRQDINRRIARTKKRLLVKWNPRERIKLMKQLVEELPIDEKKFLLDA